MASKFSTRDTILLHILKALTQVGVTDGPLDMISMHPDGERILIRVEHGPEMVIDAQVWHWPETDESKRL